MKVVIVGAHGRIARLITQRLTEAGNDVTGIIRAEKQIPDIEADGGTAAVLDIGSASVAELSEVFRSHDAVVFAAGAGGSASVYDIDRDAAIRASQAAEAAGVKRFVIISTIGAGRPDSWEGAPDYLLAKGAADDAIMASSLDWTIVRPSWLSDDKPTGTVSIGHADADPGPSVTRADIAALVADAIGRESTIRSVFSVDGGDTPIDEALSAL